MKKLLVALCLLVATSAYANFAIFQATSGNGTVSFTHVPIGGGGAVIGVSSVPAHNLLFARTDQFNCYMSTGLGQWAPLITTTNAPAGLSTTTAAGLSVVQGSGACVGAPSTATDIWIELIGSVLFSTNSGATFSYSCYPYQSDLGNSQVNFRKGFQNVIAIDPANPSIVYMGTMSSSLYLTVDKGTTCFTVSGVGSAPTLQGDYLIAFSSDLGTTATCPHSASLCTRHVFVSTAGSGTYESTDGGVTFTLRAGTNSATTAAATRADPFGNLLLIDNAANTGGGTLRVLDGAAHTWSVPAGGAIGVFGTGIDYDPNNCASAGACHIVMTNGGGGGTGTSSSGQSYTTTGYAGTWYFTSATAGATVATDVPYLADFMPIFGYYFSNGAFDNSGRIHTGGEGAFYFTPVSSGTITTTSHTLGIEETLGTSIATSTYTTGKVNVPTWDINCFIQLATPHVALPTTSPNRGCYNTNTAFLVHSSTIDWASADPSFWVVLADNQANYGGGGYIGFSGKSTDGGATWTAMSAPARISSNSLIGGCMAASSSTNYLWEGTDFSGGLIPPYYTTDGGTTWDNIIVPNNTDTVTTNGSTASGNAVLHFASVPAWLIPGQTGIYDKTNPAATVGTVKILSVTGTTVTMNLNAAATISSGDVILFSNGGWPNVDFGRQAFCTSDRVNANTFYLYNWNDQITGVDGIYKCTGGGASCALQSRPSLSGNSQYGGMIKGVPGQANNLFLSNWGALTAGTSVPDGSSGQLYYYTDGGVTKNVVALITGVTAFGFGAPFAGHTYPAIVCACFYNGVYGIWQSSDWDGAKTWQQIGTYPKNLGVFIEDIDGDKVIPNVFYYTTNSGVFCSAPSTSYCNGGT